MEKDGHFLRAKNQCRLVWWGGRFPFWYSVESERGRVSAED